MADPIYQAQYDAITVNFQATDGETDWKFLATPLDEALSDPFLPRYHGARYHIINAWCAREPQVQLQRARETLDDMVEVLWEDPPAKIDRILEPLRNMLAITEDALEKDRKEL